MFNKVARGFSFTFEALQTVQSSEKVRYFLEYINFSFGFAGLHRLIKTYFFENRKIEELDQEVPVWKQTAWKTADILGNLSLILGGAKTKPALIFWHWMIKKISLSQELENFIKSQSYLTGEKIHRNIGWLSLILGIPSTLKTFYLVYRWINSSHDSLNEKEHTHTATPIGKMDVVIAIKTVSETAQKIIAAPQSNF